LQASYVTAFLFVLAKEGKEFQDKSKYDMAAFSMLARYHQRCAGIESCICPEMLMKTGGKINTTVVDFKIVWKATGSTFTLSVRMGGSIGGDKIGGTFDTPSSLNVIIRRRLVFIVGSIKTSLEP